MPTSEPPYSQQPASRCYPALAVRQSASTSIGRLSIPTQGRLADSITANRVSQQNSPLFDDQATAGHNVSPCVICQRMKLACKLGKPCSNCIKHYHEIAERCCIQLTPTLYETLTSISRFYNLPYREAPIIPTGTCWRLTLTVPFQKDGDEFVYRPGFQMKVFIQPHSGLPGIGYQQFSIVPSSLPNITQLVQFERSSRHSATAGGIEFAIDSLLCIWEKHIDDKQLKELVREILSLASLRRISYRCYPVDSSRQEDWLSHHETNKVCPLPDGHLCTHFTKSEMEDLENSTRLPEPANSQLFAHIVRMVERLEREIFRKFDSFPYKERDPQIKGSELLIRGLCLRLVGLLYYYGQQQGGNPSIPFYSYSEYNERIIDNLDIRFVLLFWKMPWPNDEKWRNCMQEKVFKSEPRLREALENVFREERRVGHHIGDQKGRIYRKLSFECTRRNYPADRGRRT
ncbi:hypothetical protein F5Y10DRAFT_252451 [Nemania abortiva]|nr:hypothetical protein F5Y10DRAFT_252451 [Nemania abortiva]